MITIFLIKNKESAKVHYLSEISKKKGQILAFLQTQSIPSATLCTPSFRPPRQPEWRNLKLSDILCNVMIAGRRAGMLSKFKGQYFGRGS
jgi:hypothetical protein